MAATCLHCGQSCHLTDGSVVYPHRPDLAHKNFWACDDCDAFVGCHQGTQAPFGYAANKATRRARMALHELMDPIWKTQARANSLSRKKARTLVYKFLSLKMGLPSKETHSGMFDVEKCTRAKAILGPITLAQIIAELDGSEQAA